MTRHMSRLLSLVSAVAGGLGPIDPGRGYMHGKPDDPNEDRYRAEIQARAAAKRERRRLRNLARGDQ